ncbi:hypothetical protein DY000_02064263 [Brassica cretica]|uniref:Uncharacterized protein n=1 Tax=Brassica cretica TaxID=69181 RepID=A0ABQ7AZ64_BRACR|nr:hypothetical protein DY000_02064263 [Brassica cretica]
MICWVSSSPPLLRTRMAVIFSTGSWSRTSLKLVLRDEIIDDYIKTLAQIVGMLKRGCTMYPRGATMLLEHWFPNLWWIKSSGSLTVRLLPIRYHELWYQNNKKEHKSREDSGFIVRKNLIEDHERIKKRWDLRMSVVAGEATFARMLKLAHAVEWMLCTWATLAISHGQTSYAFVTFSEEEDMFDAVLELGNRGGTRGR